MKPYHESPFANITMVGSAGLEAVLSDLAKQEVITTIVETGTYLGTGSTRMLAEAFAQSQTLKALHTFEVNYFYYRQAKKNLATFPFVRCHYGCSIDINEGLAFIRQDEAIREHERWPDIYIDRTDNALAFYENELNGLLGKKPQQKLNWKEKILWQQRPKLQENLLTTCLSGAEVPLVVLDSAGGTGWLEFQTARQLLEGKKHWLLMDDIFHLKHFRSRAFVRESAAYEVLFEDADAGVMLVRYAETTAKK